MNENFLDILPIRIGSMNVSLLDWSMFASLPEPGSPYLSFTYWNVNYNYNILNSTKIATNKATKYSLEFCTKKERKDFKDKFASKIKC